MYQSVMAKRQGIGSSGTGFSFVLATIKELLPDKNICLAKDLQTGDQYQVGLNKRGETAWPQVGDTWVLDRSLGHWILQTKVTANEPPEFTGYYNTMDEDLLRLVLILKGLGLVKDGTTAGPVPVIPAVTGSKNTIRPEIQQILSILDTQGILDDQTTAATGALDAWVSPSLQGGWTGYTSGGDATVKYKRNYDNTVTVEGRATPPAGYVQGDLIFTLDSGYRPLVTKYQTTNCANGVTGTITFGNDGTVRLFDYGAATPVRCLFHMRFSLV
jgi:hypothetical protein